MFAISYYTPARTFLNIEISQVAMISGEFLDSMIASGKRRAKHPCAAGKKRQNKWTI
jgi:hypothetical protein